MQAVAVLIWRNINTGGGCINTAAVLSWAAQDLYCQAILIFTLSILILQVHLKMDRPILIWMPRDSQEGHPGLF